jgi:hypothetical protein
VIADVPINISEELIVLAVEEAEHDMENTEFLTHETTCASEMLEKTTCENFCQKRPPTSGGTPGQATRGTCRLGHCRQAPAAVAIGGTLAQVRGHTIAAPCRHHHWRQVMWQHHAATTIGGR